MGVRFANMCRFLLLSMAILAALAIASPVASTTEDTIVPEVSPAQEHNTLIQKSYADAKKTVTQVLGQSRTKAAGENACNKLADDAEAAIKKSVKEQQDLIDDMDKGENCHTTADEVVKTAKKNTQDASDEYDDATTAEQKARDKKIDTGKHQWSSLEKSSCQSTFFSDESPWGQQQTKVKAANDKTEDKKGAYDQAVKDEAAAVAEKKRLVNKCRCDVIKAHQDAVKAANDKTQAANTKAWTRAAHIKCVVAGTKIDDCTVTDAPKVKAVDLHEDTKCINYLSDSKICTTEICQKWLYNFLKGHSRGPTPSNGKAWKLCYQNTNLAEAGKYHDACRNVGGARELSLISGADGQALGSSGMPGGYILGGYNEYQCTSNSAGYESGNHGSLLFGFNAFTSDPANLNTNAYYGRVRSGSEAHEKYCYYSYGPCWGGGHDLCFYNGGTGYTNPSSFEYFSGWGSSHASNLGFLGQFASAGTTGLVYEVYKEVDGSFAGFD